MFKLNGTDTKSRFLLASWAGFIGGNISSFVKWGAESPFPPRIPTRAIPPAEMLTDLGFNITNWTYTYSLHTINWGIAGVHHVFSIVWAILYCLIAEVWPKVTLWQGAAFGLFVTIAFHAILLPVFGWAPAFWNLPMEEIVSETFGHVIWMWTIEVFRQYIINRHRTA